MYIHVVLVHWSLTHGSSWIFEKMLRSEVKAPYAYHYSKINGKEKPAKDEHMEELYNYVT